MPRPLKPADRDAWRRWLERHHATAAEVWIVYGRRGSGKASVSYVEAVEEALCFGWIDTTVRPIDETSYMQRFTPRSNVRNWSRINLERFDRMVAEGRMTPAGTAKRPDDVRPPSARWEIGDPIPRFIITALKAYPAARERFERLAPSYRRDYVRWISEAKQPATRERRLREALRRLEAGRTRVHDARSEKRPRR